MSTYQDTYCNVTTDLQQIEPNIDDYDRKRPLDGLVVHSGDVDKKDNSGYVNQLFRDGTNLGSAESALLDVTADGEWYYDSTIDTLYIYNTNDADTYLIEAGYDWATYKNTVAARRAEQIRSFVNRPIFSRQGTGQQDVNLRNYDWIIIYSNAVLAVAEIIQSTDPERAIELFNTIIDNSGEIDPPMGLLDKLKRGEYKLWNEPTRATAQGIIEERSRDASTTGTIIDTLGEASGVTYDEVIVKIVTGGTITPETGNTTVSYQVLVRDDSGYGNQEAVSETVIDNGYQPLAYGLYLRFAPGIYVADDSWIIRVSALPEETQAGVVTVTLEKC